MPRHLLLAACEASHTAPSPPYTSLATSLRSAARSPRPAPRGFSTAGNRAKRFRRQRNGLLQGVRGFGRTRPRRRICIRRAGRRTPESAALARRARLPETKPHDVRQTSTARKPSPNRNSPRYVRATAIHQAAQLLCVAGEVLFKKRREASLEPRDDLPPVA